MFLKDSLHSVIPPNIYEAENINNIFLDQQTSKMNLTIKTVLLSLLLVALYSQSATVGDSATYYTSGNQTYQYIYGSGIQDSTTLGNRDANAVTSGVQANTYIPAPTGPTPVQVTCPYNQVYDNILCQCVCIVGYYFQGADCVPYTNIIPICGKNQIYKDGRCGCDKGFFLIGNKCDICPPYSAYDLPTLSCPCVSGYALVNGLCALIYNPPAPAPKPVVPVCTINQKLVNGNCVCLENFFMIKGVCTYCVSPNYYDAQLAICRPTCSVNQVLDINTLTCICNGGFFNINGECGSCKAYSTYNRYTSACDCIQGYVLNNNNCIPATRAPVNPAPLPVKASPCYDPNQVLVDQVCICKTGYYLIKGTCSKCPTGQFYDATLAICRQPCNANQVYNKTSGVCECATSYFRINNTCTQCLGNTTFSATTKSCGCPSGYTNKGNYCVIGCGVNEIFQNGQCCCITGYYPVKGICGQCDWNEVYDQGLGICRIPCDEKRIYDISSQSCVCLPQYFQLADGTCGTCPLHSTYDYNTQSCVCDKGYISNLGLCVLACNPYENYVDGKCICKPGYYLIGYSCGVCPPTLTYDSVYRICRSGCKTNQVWDATIRACRCLPGYYLVGGVCSQCDAKTQVYDQKNQCCDCIDGYHKVSGQGCNGVCTPLCSVNQDWISGRCVCKPGYYLINNFCTQCPAGQFYDIYQRICRVQCGTNQVYNFNSGKCDCAQGFYIVLGACSQCQAAETYDSYTQTCTITPCQGVNEFYSTINGQCVCKSEYVRIKGVCTNCPPGYYYDSYSDQCLCKPGYKQVGGFCQPLCPSDQTYVNGKCQCNNGLPLYNGKCISPRLCPLNSHADKDSGCCVCNDGYSVINGQCSSYQYCGVNGYLKYGQCYCNAGFFWILGSCQPCGTNEAYNGVVCECLVGYVRNVNGQCIKSNFVPNCYDNERYDSTIQACVCVTGTQYLRGKCVTVPTCPSNAYYNGLTCVCNSGLILDNGACVSANVVVPACPDNAYFNGVSCTCSSGFYQPSLGACAACATGTSWNGQACAATASTTCAAGYIYNTASSVCEPSAPSCGDNSIWNGASCVCVSGFNLINGVCQKCAAGTTFDGVQCSSSSIVATTVTCDSNQIVVNGACVCNAGFYNIGGKCLSCPANTKWNGAYCQCLCNVTQWCLGRPYTDLANNCDCQSGYTLVNGLCTASV